MTTGDLNRRDPDIEVCALVGKGKMDSFLLPSCPGKRKEGRGKKLFQERGGGAKKRAILDAKDALPLAEMLEDQESGLATAADP